MKCTKNIILPGTLGDGRLDSILKTIGIIRSQQKHLQLDWTRVGQITPAGYAILACVHDLAMEHLCKLKPIHVKKKFQDSRVIGNLKKHQGQLTIISRNAQLRRYFNQRTVRRGSLKFPLPGTWCFARFPLERKA